MNPVPEVGKTYKFYDDGKICKSHQYDTKVLRIVSPEEAKQIMFPLYYDADNKELTTRVVRIKKSPCEKSLYDCWRDQIKEHLQGVGDPWLYANETDWFIECTIPEYEPDYTVWFVRDVKGGWFSMDIQAFWMSGALDVTNEMTKCLEKAKF